MESSIGQTLITFGWCGIIVGILTGGVLSAYAFSGPFKPPKGHEDYTALNRRMLRLAHIATVMLPLISIIYGMHIDTVNLSDNLKFQGVVAMMVFTVGIPTFLIAACFYLPLKYFNVISINAGIYAFSLMALGRLNWL